MADQAYLPGTKALLVYQDEQGVNRSTIVEVVACDIKVATGWQAIKARREVFGQVFNIPPIRNSQLDVEEGWAVSTVSEERLAPIGTRIFHIVQ